MVCVIKRVRDEWGWMSNMSPCVLLYGGICYYSSEALFQALRFTAEADRRWIAAIRNPYDAKMAARRILSRAAIEPRSERDVSNMRLVVEAKINQHPALAERLRETGDRLIVEDGGKRNDRFWGAMWTGSSWEGRNELGKAWMSERDQLSKRLI